MAQCGTCNWSFVKENWQLKWRDRCGCGRMGGRGGVAKHVYHVISRCRCRIKSYLKVTLSPSSTVMLSGRCPNSAPYTLDPAKKNENRHHWASNKFYQTVRWCSSISGQVLEDWLPHQIRLGGGCAVPPAYSFLKEKVIYTKQKSHNVCSDPHTWIMIWFLPCILVGSAFIEQHW